MIEFNLSFYWLRFFLALLFTFLPFMWLRKEASWLTKFYFIGIICLIFVYSGVGAGWEDTPSEYLVLYCVYMVVLGLTCKITVYGKKKSFNRRENVSSNGLESFISRYGGIFIFMYIFIPFLQLLLQGNILNIVHPPSMSLQDAVEGRYETSRSFLESVFWYLSQLILPFYVVCLYKYRNNIAKLAFALLIPLYFVYASSGYLSRSGILPFLIIIYIAFYIKYPKYRKRMILYTVIGMPLFLFGLSWFTFARLGREIDVSFSDALALLARQETYYPSQYEEYQNWPFDGHLMLSYLDWLVKLPLPGFLKSTSFDQAFNVIFTEKMTGGSRLDSNFSVMLPGLVGEGIFIFGRYFFWVHAIIVGWALSMAFKLAHHKQELFLVLYMTFYCGISIARGGSVSTLPFYFKHLIIYLIVIYFVTKQKRRKASCLSNAPIESTTDIQQAEL